MKVGAGQFVYIRVPELGYEWHPFSLASASTDTNLELLVGVIGDREHWQKVEQEKARAAAAKQAAERTAARQAKSKPGTIIMAEVPAEPPKWVMKPSRATWTFRLEQLMRRRINELAFKVDPERQADEVKPIQCVVRGPYGSTFNDAFDPKYTGVVVIGAGTGLTAALSVLRELVMRRRRSIPSPKYVWFVWATRDTNDLLLLWNSMTDLLLDALHDGVLRPGGGWTHESNMLDWLCISIYVTQGSANAVEAFKQEVAPLGARPTDRRRSCMPSNNDAEFESKGITLLAPQPPRDLPVAVTVDANVPEARVVDVEVVPLSSAEAAEVKPVAPTPRVVHVAAATADSTEDVNTLSVIQLDDDEPDVAAVEQVVASVFSPRTPTAPGAVADADADAPVAELVDAREAVTPTPIASVSSSIDVESKPVEAVARSETATTAASTQAPASVRAAVPSNGHVAPKRTDSSASASDRGADLPDAHHGARPGRREVTPWELHDWMTHPHRLLVSKSLDDHNSHILKLLQWVRLYLNRKAGRGRRITIACCGPPSVAQTVANAADRVGGNVQFAAEHV